MFKQFRFVRVSIPSVFAVALVILAASSSAFSTKWKWDVPYFSQLDYSQWGQSACGPTSAAMMLRYHYPNSGVDVAEVYAAATQVYTYGATSTGAPMLGYRNVGFEYSSSPRDTGLSRVPSEFRGFYRGGDDSSMNGKFLETYLRNAWGGLANFLDGRTMDHLIAEVKLRPVIANVIERPGTLGHYIVVVGYDDKGSSGPNDDTFFINDPYPPYHNGFKGTKEVTFAQLKGWFDQKKRMITFQPDPAQNANQRKYSTLVDNGIDNSPDTGNLNRSCQSGYSCFELGNRSEKIGNTYFWQRYHGAGKDWVFPARSGSHAKFRPYLAKSGRYEVYVRFWADPGQNNVTYEVRKANTTVVASKAINQRGSGFKSLYLGRFDLSNGMYVQATNIPANCNVDSVFFRFVG